MEAGKLQIHAVGKGTLKAAKAAGWSAVAIAGQVGTIDINSPELEDLEGLEIPLVDLGSAEITVGGGAHAETLVNRATRELGRIGCVVLSVESGVGATFGFMGVEVGDLIPAAGLLLEVSRRTTKKVVQSDHQLSWYDLKQTIGLVWAAQNGDEDAMALAAWGDGKINEIREQEKAVIKAAQKERAVKKAEERAKVKAAEKAAEKAKEEEEVEVEAGAGAEELESEELEEPTTAKLATAPLASTLKSKK